MFRVLEPEASDDKKEAEDDVEMAKEILGNIHPDIGSVKNVVIFNTLSSQNRNDNALQFLQQQNETRNCGKLIKKCVSSSYSRKQRILDSHLYCGRRLSRY